MSSVVSDGAQTCCLTWYCCGKLHNAAMPCFHSHLHAVAVRFSLFLFSVFPKREVLCKLLFGVSFLVTKEAASPGNISVNTAHYSLVLNCIALHEQVITILIFLTDSPTLAKHNQWLYSCIVPSVGLRLVP